MNQLELRKLIATIASQLASNPEQLQAQIEMLRPIMPGVTDDQVRGLVKKVLDPGFDEKTIAADLNAIVRH